MKKQYVPAGRRGLAKGGYTPRGQILVQYDCNGYNTGTDSVVVYGKYFYISDRLGSVRLVVDSTGIKYRYLPSFSKWFWTIRKKIYSLEPREPSLPQEPISDIEKIRQQLSVVPDFSRYIIPDIEPPSSFSIKRTNSYDISDSFRVIKHNERECLPELFLRFNSIEKTKSFRCEYRVTIDNLPEEIKGNINFKFQTDSVN